jgi:hypothetical protein
MINREMHVTAEVIDDRGNSCSYQIYIYIYICNGSFPGREFTGLMRRLNTMILAVNPNKDRGRNLRYNRVRLRRLRIG